MALTPEEQRRLDILQNRLTVIQQAIDDGASGDELMALQNDQYETQQQVDELQADDVMPVSFLSPDELYESAWNNYQIVNPPPGGEQTPEYVAASRPTVLQYVKDTVDQLPTERQDDFSYLIQALEEAADFRVDDTEEILSESLAIIDAEYDESLGDVDSQSPIQMYVEVKVENNTATAYFTGDDLVEDFVVRSVVEGVTWDTFVPAGLSTSEVAERVALEAPSDLPIGQNNSWSSVIWTKGMAIVTAPVVTFLRTLHVDIEPTVLPSQTISLIFAGEFVPAITYRHSYLLDDGSYGYEYDPIQNDDIDIVTYIAGWAANLTASQDFESVTVSGGGMRIDIDCGAGVQADTFSAIVENSYNPEPIQIDGSPPDLGADQFMIRLLGDAGVDDQALWVDLLPYVYYGQEISEGITRDSLADEISAALGSITGLSTQIVNGYEIIVKTTDGGSFDAADAAVIFDYTPFTASATLVSDGTAEFSIQGANPIGNESIVFSLRDTSGINRAYPVILTRASTAETIATDLVSAVTTDGSFTASVSGGTTVIIDAVGAANFVSSAIAQTIYGAGAIAMTSNMGASYSTITIKGGPANGTEFLSTDITVDEPATRRFTYGAVINQSAAQLATALGSLINDDPLLLAITSKNVIEIWPADNTLEFTSITTSVTTAEPAEPVNVAISGAGPSSTEVLVTILGGPAVGGEQVSWSITPDGGAPITGTSAAASADDSVNSIASVLATSIDTDENLSAVASGAIVTVTPSGTTTNITNATASVVADVVPFS